MALWNPWKGRLSDLCEIWVILLLDFQRNINDLCCCLCNCKALTSKQHLFCRWCVFFFQYTCTGRFWKQTYTNTPTHTHTYRLSSQHSQHWWLGNGKQLLLMICGHSAAALGFTLKPQWVLQQPLSPETPHTSRQSQAGRQTTYEWEAHWR